MKKLLLIIILALAINLESSAQREVININKDWKFSYGWQVDKDKAVEVNLPHTYNLDALSGKIDYFRGAASYVKMFEIPKGSVANKRIFLKCKGINHTAMLFVNAKYVETHKGGYTAFTVDITPYLNDGRNSIWIRTSNALDLNVAPLVGDFNFYGGIYRDVELIVTPNTNIAPNYWGSNGVFVSTPLVTRQEATVEVKAIIQSSKQTSAKVEFRILDANDNVIKTTYEKYKLSPYSQKEAVAEFTIQSPILWQGTENPYLYKTVVKIIDEEQTGKHIKTDSVVQNFALRYFEVTTGNQFLLNGIPTQIKGVCKHQDYAGLGNAIHRSNHQEDMRWMKEMGANGAKFRS